MKLELYEVYMYVCMDRLIEVCVKNDAKSMLKIVITQLEYVFLSMYCVYLIPICIVCTLYLYIYLIYYDCLIRYFSSSEKLTLICIYV